jgi:uncharacterized protein YndB with AHSA1/START domain
MTTTYAPLLEDAIEIEATPDRVWTLVGDVRRMADFSPQVTSTRLRSGFDEVTLGAEFTNRNRQGDLEWTTHGRVVELEPGRRIAFRIEENWLVWSFTLEPTGTGTRLHQRREAPDGISELSLELTDGFLGGQEAFTETMRAGMRQTLEAIRAAAEA